MEIKDVIAEDITSLIAKVDRFLDGDDPAVIMANGLLATALYLIGRSGETSPGDDGPTGEESDEPAFEAYDDPGDYGDEPEPEPEPAPPPPSRQPVRSLADDMGIGFNEGARPLRRSRQSAEEIPFRRKPRPRRQPSPPAAEVKPPRNLADEWAGPLPKRPMPSAAPVAPPAPARKIPPTVSASGVCVGCNGYYGAHPENHNYPRLNGQVPAVTLCDGRAVYVIGGTPADSP